MSTNGHRTTKDRLVSVLQLNGGQLSLKEVIFDYHFTRSQLDDVLEMAHTPITVRVQYNGNPKPGMMVVLRNYTATPSKPKTQAEVAQALNSMSPAQYRSWLESVDPTFAIRRSSHGRHRRTSTGADEYLGPQ
jgi:hypothetical protein